MSENKYLEINLRKFSHNLVILLIALTYFISIKALIVHKRIINYQRNTEDLSNMSRKLLFEECSVQQKQLQKQNEQTHEEDAVKSSEEGDF